MPMSIKRVNALGRIVRVQRAENQVTRQRGANGDFGRFQVANFADHDHVRVLAQNMAQAHREGQPDFRTHRDLVDAFQFVFDRFLNRDDAFVNRVDRAEKRVERGRFAGTGRAGDQQNAVRLDDDFANARSSSGGENPSLSRLKKDFAARQQTQRNAFAINRRHRRNADIDFLALDADVDASVLRQAFFGDVHPAT